MKNVSLGVQSLSIGYIESTGNKMLLKDLNIHLKDSKLICLLGPNGSGKTTLLKTLGGILQALSGNIYLGDNKLSDLSGRDRAKVVSFLPTKKTWPGEFSVWEVIAMGRHPHTVWTGKLAELDRISVQRAIELLGIGEFQYKNSREISDGEQQRMWIAMAITQETPIILLDEPTAFLDWNQRRNVLSLLKDLTRSKSVSILVSTHELDLALELADEIWIAEPPQLLMGIASELLATGIIEKCFPGYGKSI